tara:strand:- start:10 stop:1200 length:1191 start_codon:yes stop_codon:yes gene_type:complete
MRKNEINARFRAHVQENLSPTQEDREFVSSVYRSICELLGNVNCLQIGSYPRFTAIRPLHDLDVLYILEDWFEGADPSRVLEELEGFVLARYENPTTLNVSVERQTHSISLSFLDNGEEVFSVDIVPAYKLGKNDFGDDRYMVPELVSKSHKARRILMEENRRLGCSMTWIRSDPRGYIKGATNLNKVNADFRKTAKFVKGWRAAWKAVDDDFPLKSFHLELIVTNFFNDHPEAEIFDAVFHFFCSLPVAIDAPNIPDRADTGRFVDAYLADLTTAQKEQINQARDHFLIQLENFGEESDVGDLLVAEIRKRASVSEQYLFDFGIPVLTEVSFSIVGNVQERTGGFRARILNALGIIEVDRKIEFVLGRDAPATDLFKWKVKNDDNGFVRRKLNLI